MGHARDLLLSISAVAMVLLGAARQSAATTVDATGISNQGWVAEAQVAPGARPCNYFYTNGRYELLYYGTSGNCQARIAQHSAIMRNAIDMLETMRDFLEASGSAEVAVGQINALFEWVKATDRRGVSENHGSSDSCLAAAQVKGHDVSVWYKPLASRGSAANVEACVLREVIGYCNRAGAGNTRVSWVDFTATLGRCDQ